MHRVDNIMPIDTIESFGQVFIAAIVVDQLLNLSSVELGVVEDCHVGAERAKDAIAAEKDDAIVVVFHGCHEIVDGRLLLEEVCLVLGRRMVRGGLMTGVGVVYNGERHGDRSEKTNHKREPDGWFGNELHGEVRGNDACYCGFRENIQGLKD